ncbi:MAG: nuclear transport factor 2 family protein [Saprospiraceae bacterium]|nr:nuclear transport factor 2 family protein [Saprospiraceae bacterium]
MKKKLFFNSVFIILFIRGIVFGQNSIDVSSSVLKLHDALVSMDTIILHQVLDDQMTYGHSNGWIESKAELILNNFTRKMIYQSITEDSISIQITGTTAIARFNAVIKGNVGEKSFHLKLHICQTWILRDDSWKLLARQAVKLELPG